MIIWDDRKRRLNLEKHGLDFAALTVEFFEGARFEATRQGRFLVIGELDAEIVAVVCRPLGSEALAIVSMRPASKSERRRL